MITRKTPDAWRRGYALYRRRRGTDSLGDETAWYDMSAPDLVVEDGDAAGICFQHRRGWLSSGTLDSAGASVAEYGERANGVLEGVSDSKLEAEPFDRFLIGGALYELRAVQNWPNHRHLLLQRVQ